MVFLNCILSECTKTFTNLQTLKTHIKSEHYMNVNLSSSKGFTCNTEGCKKVFKKLKDWYIHLNNFHILNIKNMNKVKIIASNNKKKSFIDFPKNVCKLVADVRAKNPVVNASTIERFLTDTESYTDIIMSEAKEMTLEFLKEHGIDTSSPAAKEYLHKFDTIDDFKQYKTHRGQIKALKEEYLFVEPTEIYLGGTRFEHRIINMETQIKEIPESFQYIPIIDTLQLVLSNKEILDYVKNEKSRNDGFITNFRDAENFKNNDFFQKYTDAIRLQFYNDDIVINNALGTKTVAHKLSIFYFSIQNMPKYINSCLSSIHLVAICYACDVEKYGINKILERFMIDLKKLESNEGVKIKLGGEDFTLRASLAGVAADSLALHQLFGFLSPSANLFCPICTISREDFNNFVNFVAQHRNQEDHTKQIKDSQRSKKLRSSSGVKENTSFHLSKYFHITSNFMSDFMHNMFEGIASYELKLVINHMVFSPEYDLDIKKLNNRINQFNYGFPDIKDKPTANFNLKTLGNLNDHKLKQKAMQTWCLCRVFPFIVSDIVKEGDEYLELIILLNKINEIAMAQKLHKNILPYLDYLLTEHETLFRQLFPNASKINKLHLIGRHLVECIKKSGLSRDSACFKYEMKHFLFTRLGANIYCFKNLPKSCATAAQIDHAAFWGAKKKCLREKIVIRKKECKALSETLSASFLADLGFAANDVVYTNNTIEVYGIDYKINSFLAIKAGDDSTCSMPLFGKIKEIIFDQKNEVFFFCQIWSSDYLNEFLNAYKVTEEEEFQLVKWEDLCDSKPYSLWYDYKSCEPHICLRQVLY